MKRRQQVTKRRSKPLNLKSDDAFTVKQVGAVTKQKHQHRQITNPRPRIGVDHVLIVRDPPDSRIKKSPKRQCFHELFWLPRQDLNLRPSGYVALPMIGKLFGHTQVQTTAQYAHLASDSVKASGSRVGDSIGLHIAPQQVP